MNLKENFFLYKRTCSGHIAATPWLKHVTPTIKAKVLRFRIYLFLIFSRKNWIKCHILKKIAQLHYTSMTSRLIVSLFKILIIAKQVFQLVIIDLFAMFLKVTWNEKTTIDSLVILIDSYTRTRVVYWCISIILWNSEDVKNQKKSWIRQSSI